MTVEEVYTRTQHKIESLLASFFPENLSPYFDRNELVSKLLHIASLTAMEVTQTLFEHIKDYVHSASPRVLYMPVCPKCNAELIAKEDKAWDGMSALDFLASQTQEVMRREAASEEFECPNCHNGTVVLEDGHLVCAGECGAIFGKPSSGDEKKTFGIRPIQEKK